MTRRYVLVAIQVGLGLACLYAAFQLAYGFEVGALLTNWPWIGLLAIGWVLNQIVCAWRLQILLSVVAVRLPYVEVLRLTLSSFIAASVLPGVIAGDIAKIALVKLSTQNVRLADITIVALLDRVLGFLSLWLLSFVISFFIAVPDTGAAATLLQFVRFGFVLAVCAVAVTIVGATTLAWAVDRWAGRLPDRVVAVSHVLFRVLRDRGALRTIALAAIPVSLLAVAVLVGIQAWVGGRIMLSIGEPASTLLQSFLAPVSIIVSSLPLAPSGIGIGQLTLGASYSVMALPPETALILTSLVQLSQIGLACTVAPFVLRGIRTPSPAP